MRAWLACLALTGLLTVSVGCGGKGHAALGPLSKNDFKLKVAAAIVTGSDLQAEPGFGPKVDVSSRTSLNTFSLSYAKEYARYRAHPGRESALIRGLVRKAKTLMARGNAGETFAGARSLILPVLKPDTAFRRLTSEPALTPFPGHLFVAYAVQRPESFTVVTHGDVRRWKQPLGEIHRLALANLLRETNRAQGLKCEEKLCGWASGDGYDAARMIVPELRRQIVGKIGPSVYAVPRESVFVALPIKLAGRIRAKVMRDFVTAPNPVSQDLFVERGGDLVVLRQ